MAAQKWVEIRHPNVNKTAIVAAVSLPHHRAAGWEPVEPTDPAPPQADRQARTSRPQNRPQPAPSTAESEGTS